MEEIQQNTPFLIGPEQADTACLLIHGFSGTPNEMRRLGDALAEKGIRVYGMVVAGHSGDADDLIRTSRKQWLASVETAFSQLSQYSYIFVGGLSMGGALSLLLASRHPERVTGVIVLSNLMRVSAPGWQGIALHLLPIVRHFMPWFYPLSTLNFNNPKVQAEVLKQAHTRDPNVTIDFSDPQTVEYIKKQVRIPIAAIDELVHLTAEERRKAKRVRSPLLIIHSRRDQTALPQGAEELYKLATQAQPKTLYWLEQSDHVITTGPEHEKVYRLVLSFITTTVQAAVKNAPPVNAPLVEEDGKSLEH